jgi:hypothetical protein
MVEELLRNPKFIFPSDLWFGNLLDYTEKTGNNAKIKKLIRNDKRNPNFIKDPLQIHNEPTNNPITNYFSIKQ